MIDLSREFKRLARTGRFSLGTSEALQAARSGRAKIIILSSNGPEPERSNIIKYAALSEVPVHISDNTSADFAAICEKPFLVSAISIHETGDSNLLQLVTS